MISSSCLTLSPHPVVVVDVQFTLPSAHGDSLLFQYSLQKMLMTLNEANPFFIRCIKSNKDKVCDPCCDSCDPCWHLWSLLTHMSSLVATHIIHSSSPVDAHVIPCWHSCDWCWHSCDPCWHSCDPYWPSCDPLLTPMWSMLAFISSLLTLMSSNVDIHVISCWHFVACALSLKLPNGMFEQAFHNWTDILTIFH